MMNLIKQKLEVNSKPIDANEDEKAADHADVAPDSKQRPSTPEKKSAPEVVAEPKTPKKSALKRQSATVAADIAHVKIDEKTPEKPKPSSSKRAPQTKAASATNGHAHAHKPAKDDKHEEPKPTPTPNPAPAHAHAPLMIDPSVYATIEVCKALMSSMAEEKAKDREVMMKQNDKLLDTIKSITESSTLALTSATTVAASMKQFGIDNQLLNVAGKKRMALPAPPPPHRGNGVKKSKKARKSDDDDEDDDDDDDDEEDDEDDEEDEEDDAELPASRPAKVGAKKSRSLGRVVAKTRKVLAKPASLPTPTAATLADPPKYKVFTDAEIDDVVRKIETRAKEFDEKAKVSCSIVDRLKCEKLKPEDVTVCLKNNLSKNIKPRSGSYPKTPSGNRVKLVPEDISPEEAKTLMRNILLKTDDPEACKRIHDCMTILLMKLYPAEVESYAGKLIPGDNQQSRLYALFNWTNLRKKSLTIDYCRSRLGSVFDSGMPTKLVDALANYLVWFKYELEYIISGSKQVQKEKEKIRREAKEKEREQQDAADAANAAKHDKMDEDEDDDEVEVRDDNGEDEDEDEDEDDEDEDDEDEDEDDEDEDEEEDDDKEEEAGKSGGDKKEKKKGEKRPVTGTKSPIVQTATVKK